MEDRADRIRQRAHELWEHAGKPEGREIDFWLQAERELAGEIPSDGSDGTTQPNNTSFPG